MQMKGKGRLHDFFDKKMKDNNQSIKTWLQELNVYKTKICKLEKELRYSFDNSECLYLFTTTVTFLMYLSFCSTRFL